MIRQPLAVVLMMLLLALTGCRHGRCYRDSDCHTDLVCLDPTMKVAAAAKRCEPGQIRCVAGCQARCSQASCGDALSCGESGCCEAKSCKLNNDCPRAESCIDGRCTAPGTCMEPSAG
jgi:hypothetical protein